MAVNLRAYTVEQIEKAHAAAKNASKWAEGVENETGLRFVLFSSRSQLGEVHKTHFAGLGCSCRRGERNLPLLAYSLVPTGRREGPGAEAAKDVRTAFRG